MVQYRVGNELGGRQSPAPVMALVAHAGWTIQSHVRFETGAFVHRGL